MDKEEVEWCVRDRCEVEDRNCLLEEAKVCDHTLIVADVVDALDECDEDRDVDCAVHKGRITPTIVRSHDGFSSADDIRHSTSSCDECEKSRTLCRTRCQLRAINQNPCPRDYCAQQQNSCHLRCNYQTVSSDPAFWEDRSSAGKAGLSSCAGGRPLNSDGTCKIRPTIVPRGYLPQRF